MGEKPRGSRVDLLSRATVIPLLLAIDRPAERTLT
jgi:hypothetical protein